MYSDKEKQRAYSRMVMARRRLQKGLADKETAATIARLNDLYEGAQTKFYAFTEAKKD